MATVADSLMDRTSNTTAELIGKVAKEIMYCIDPVFRKLILSSANVTGDGIGRDYRLKKRFYGSLAGVVEEGAYRNQVGLYGDSTRAFGPKLYQQNFVETLPLGSEGANPAGYGMTMQLHDMWAAFSLSLGQLQLDALPANIREHIAPVYTGTAMNIAERVTQGFYANGEESYRISDLGPSTGDGAYVIDTVNKRIRFFPPQQNVKKYKPGMPVDIFINTTTMANKQDTPDSDNEDRVRLFVHSASPWHNEVTLQAQTDEKSVGGSTATFATWTATLAEDSFVVHAFSYKAGTGFSGFYNFRDFTKWGDATAANADKRILGSRAITDTTDDYIDVSVHPEFMSGHYEAIGALSREKLLAILSNVFYSLPCGQTIDTLIFSRGIILNMFEQLIGKERINYNAGGGYTGSISPMGLKNTEDGGMEIVHEGRTVVIYTSDYMENGTAYGLRRGSNWAIARPPEPSEISGSFPGDTKGVLDKIPLSFPNKFLVGHGHINFPILTTDGRQTTGTNFPMLSRFQLFPQEQIPGLILEGINTTRQYSDQT